MLTRKHRFHGLGSLNFVYRHGATVRGQHLGLRYALNKQRQEYRVAVIVSRKIHKSAVLRNRLRRRLYEIVRVGPRIEKPYDLVFTAFSDQVSTMKPAELHQAVQRLLQKSGAPTSEKRAPGCGIVTHEKE